MLINPTFELSMIVDSKQFEKLFARICSKSDCFEESEEEYIDCSLAEKGITVILRNSQYKKKVRLIVNSCIMLKGSDIDPEKLVRKLSKQIDEYFGKRYQLCDFKLSKVVLTADINVHSHENLSAYLKIFHRIGKVKGFSQVHYDCFEEGTSFCLEGNSNGIDFLTYDLGRALCGRLENGQLSRKKIASMLDKTATVLRAEVRLTKSNVIQNFTEASDVAEQILVILNNKKDLFFKVFAHVVPFGDFYKKDKAIEIVRKNVDNTVLRRKMIRLIALVPEKKSLWLAQKALGSRDIDNIMGEFAKINLSPVTVSKRSVVKWLENIFSYLTINGNLL